MVDFTSDERLSLETAFANLDPSTVDLNTNVGDKDTLCTVWSDVEKVLKFVAALPFVPKSIVDAIKAVIAAGQAASGALCGGAGAAAAGGGVASGGI